MNPNGISRSPAAATKIFLIIDRVLSVPQSLVVKCSVRINPRYHGSSRQLWPARARSNAARCSCWSTLIACSPVGVPAPGGTASAGRCRRGRPTASCASAQAGRDMPGDGRGSERPGRSEHEGSATVRQPRCRKGAGPISAMVPRTFSALVAPLTGAFRWCRRSQPVVGGLVGEVATHRGRFRPGIGNAGRCSSDRCVVRRRRFFRPRGR